MLYKDDPALCIIEIDTAPTEAQERDILAHIRRAKGFGGPPNTLTDPLEIGNRRSAKEYINKFAENNGGVVGLAEQIGADAAVIQALFADEYVNPVDVEKLVVSIRNAGLVG
jgi:hypothetical protein